MDAKIVLEITGIVIAVIFGTVNMWWQSVLSRREIQATLQAAQPDDKIKQTRKTRKKVFGPKQRHVLKILRLMRLVIIILLVVTLSDLWIFFFPPLKLYLDIPLAIIIIFVYWSGIRVLLNIRKSIREVEAGNRALIDELYNAFPPRA